MPLTELTYIFQTAGYGANSQINQVLNFGSERNGGICPNPQIWRLEATGWVSCIYHFVSIRLYFVMLHIVLIVFYI